MSTPRPQDAGAQRSGGRAPAAASAQHPESDAETERGSADVSVPGTTAERGSAERPTAEQPTRIESLHELQKVLQQQLHLFTVSWEDMKVQVNRALRHKHWAPPPPQQATRPNTPTNAHGASPCRTPPCNSGGEGRGAQRPSGLGPATGSWAAAGGSQSDNMRESILQTWSYLGSRLQEIVHRNGQLEEENDRLRMDLAKLQQRISDVQQALGDLPPPQQPGGRL